MDYKLSNSDIMWMMKDIHHFRDPIPYLQVMRKRRILRSDWSGDVWPIPEDWDLS